ncbi:MULTISPECIES: J domain-containing protein [Paenibacillus]|uniref:J domain-containing protein n=1 Tax=Paenibacillus TaxID=44249 RepID=UPI002DB87E90|nr:J domain-containing protein [Paenibacillus odorifer]MEC0129739.1 J domain-containing protein [Paenibacillus odorifer]MEC0224017.1 J domain-containing protein [Paenibacillus odorifer]
MTIWSMLEIEPTDELAIIKKAYAKKLKSHHPEDDPEGYQQLREAYDTAVKWARSGQRIASTVPSFVGEDKKEIAEAISKEIEEMVIQAEKVIRVDEAEEEEGEEKAEGATFIPHENEWTLFRPHPIQLDADLQEQPAAIFDRQIRELYADFSRRIKQASWHSLLNEDFMWSIEHRDRLRDKLMLFLDQHRNLPYAVWEALDSFFHFREDKEIFLQRYDNKLVEYILGQVDGSLEMRYECFLLQASLEFDIEHYLNLRRSAQFMLMEDKHTEAGQLLDEANKLFQNDPDLQLMRAKYCLDTADYMEALVCLNQVTTMWPNERDGYLLRGRLLYYLQRYEEAMKDCEYLLQEDAGNRDVQCLILECKIARSQTEEALTQTETNEPKKDEFVHFRYLANKYMLKNKKLYPQRLRISSLVTIGKNIIGPILFYLLVFLKLSWFYILVYTICYFSVSELPPLVNAVFILIILWKIRNICKTAYLFSN